MNSNALPTFFGSYGRRFAALVALSVALVIAFVLAPPVLASAWSGRSFRNEDDLVIVAREAFVDYWASGHEGLSPGLQAVADYWAWYHVAKTVIALLLLATVVMLGISLGMRYVTSGDVGRGHRSVLAAAGVLTTTVAVVAALAVMANVQGAIMPFSSMLSLLPIGQPSGAFADTVDQIGRFLAEGRLTPALETMIVDFADYHAVMAVIAACASVLLLGLSALTWIRFVRARPSDRRVRLLLGGLGSLANVAVLALIVVTVANAGTAADPAPALAAFFEGGVL